MRIPTLHDVARAAGVSYSTADRVLNDRGKVAEKSAQRVRDAMESLGYRRDIRAANLARQRAYRFRFFLPQGDHGFYTVLREALEAQVVPRRSDRILIERHDVPALDDAALAARLEATAPGDCDAIALVGIQSPRLEAAIARLVAAGIPVLTLVSDAAEGVRALYVGIDNVAAGRTAGRLIRLAHRGGQGVVLPILGRRDLRDHADRLAGVTEVLAEPGATCTILPPLEVLDQPERMSDSLARALREAPAITAIYSIGAGNRALIGLLRGLPAPRPVVVLHELTAHSRAALEAGLVDAVIDQKPAEEIARALDAMTAIADGMAPQPARIVPMIYLHDNLPASAEAEAAAGGPDLATGSGGRAPSEERIA